MRKGKSAMDEAEAIDFDAAVRLKCIEITTWLLDHSGRETFDLDEVLDIAMALEDYIQNGGTVNVVCSNSGFVR